MTVGQAQHIGRCQLLAGAVQPVSDTKALLLICGELCCFILVGEELGQGDAESIADLHEGWHRGHIGLVEHGAQGRVGNPGRFCQTVIRP